jgi:hypothetical protein
MPTTRLNRPWLVKMVLFFALLLFFGLYGLYDAMIAYPQRGLRHASYQEWQYLDAARVANQLDAQSVSVPDPRAELQRLSALEPARFGPLDGPRLEWLRSLQRAGALRPETTTIADARARYTQLNTQWANTTAQPKPLAAFDIPVQWLFVVIGLGGVLWMLVLFASVARQRYSWDPQTRTLTLPGGQALTPADAEDFDKRKWDKFLVFVKVKPSHPTLGGRELKLDLYRHTPLESWVLEMERAAFPDRSEPEPAPST